MDSIRNGGNSDSVSPRRQSASDKARVLEFEVYSGDPFVGMLVDEDNAEAVYHDVLLVAATFGKPDGEKRVLLCQSIVGFRIPTPDHPQILALSVDERLKLVAGHLVSKNEALNPDGQTLESVLVKTRCVGKRKPDGTFTDEDGAEFGKPTGGTDEPPPPSADPRLN